jgi:hypothetical protein
VNSSAFWTPTLVSVHHFSPHHKSSYTAETNPILLVSVVQPPPCERHDIIHNQQEGKSCRCVAFDCPWAECYFSIPTTLNVDEVTWVHTHHTIHRCKGIVTSSCWRCHLHRYIPSQKYKLKQVHLV